VDFRASFAAVSLSLNLPQNAAPFRVNPQSYDCARNPKGASIHRPWRCVRPAGLSGVARLRRFAPRLLQIMQRTFSTREHIFVVSNSAPVGRGWGGDFGMAIFYLDVGILSRAGGRSSLAAAAYRRGTKLRDERDGKTHDYTSKSDVVHSEIMLPEHAPTKFQARPARNFNQKARTRDGAGARICEKSIIF